VNRSIRLGCELTFCFSSINTSGTVKGVSSTLLSCQSSASDQASFRRAQKKSRLPVVRVTSERL
jgi:hypothetical protein